MLIVILTMNYSLYLYGIEIFIVNNNSAEFHTFPNLEFQFVGYNNIYRTILIISFMFLYSS